MILCYVNLKDLRPLVLDLSFLSSFTDFLSIYKVAIRLLWKSIVLKEDTYGLFVLL